MIYAIPILVFLFLVTIVTIVYRKETNTVSYWVYIVASAVISMQVYIQIK